MEKKIINMTPHDVCIVGSNNEVIRTYPSQGSIRLSEERQPLYTVNGISVNSKKYGSAELPPIAPDTMYIVSLAVGQAFPERRDFLIPDNIVRDEKGAILGCTSFTVFGK